MRNSLTNTPAALASSPEPVDHDHLVDPFGMTHGIAGAGQKWPAGGRAGGWARVMPHGRTADRLITRVTRSAIGGIDMNMDTDTDDVVEESLGAEIASAMSADNESDLGSGIGARSNTQRRGDEASEPTRPSEPGRGPATAALHPARPRRVSSIAATDDVDRLRLGGVPSNTLRAKPKQPGIGNHRGATPGRTGKLLVISVIVALATIVLALLAEPPPPGDDRSASNDKPANTRAR